MRSPAPFYKFCAKLDAAGGQERRDLIRRLRLKGLSLREIARAVGTSKSTVSRLK